MKLSPITKENILQAAYELDGDINYPWAEYFIYIEERKKEYPFKLLIRKAYEIATNEHIATDFFQSNTGNRNYIANKFGYIIYFKIRDNIPFFNKEEIEYFSNYNGKSYRSDNEEDGIAGSRLKETVYNKTNVWAKALNLDGFILELDNQWQISGTFKKYTWVKIYKISDRNKKIFFTIGVDAEEEALVYKLDCQRKSYNPEKALNFKQREIFDRLVHPTAAKWHQIYIDELENWTWESLIEDTLSFIEYYLPLYDEVVSAVWDISFNNENNYEKSRDKNPINIVSPPKGILSPPQYKKFRGGNSNPDYDKENKEKKKIGDAGEALIIKREKEILESLHLYDLASQVIKVPDWEGYDILSYETNGEPKYIEVKTTVGSIYRPFVFTRNEKMTMKEYSSYYCLYRLFNFDIINNKADCFILKGDFSELVWEDPLQYNIYLKG